MPGTMRRNWSGFLDETRSRETRQKLWHLKETEHLSYDALIRMLGFSRDTIYRIMTTQERIPVEIDQAIRRLYMTRSNIE
jgi:predicted transcriptional regulator